MLSLPALSDFIIQNAELDWIEQDGVDIPVSKQFGDVYFSRANGLAETRHVFLNGNRLLERLSQLKPYQYFCVGETGFGTGLNVLALWQLWRQCRPDNHSRLHVITVEKYPLSRSDLTRALKAWPELSELSEQLLSQYPPALPGCHRLIFKEDRFSLDIWLGDAATYLPQIETQHAIDAWFMDGFAPKCNPELWQENILANMIRLSGPGTTFASFSVAGIVKQGLRSHGIVVKRPPGFGRKREMLQAWWPEQDDFNGLATEDASSTHKPIPHSIAIIGAGIAGLSVAHAFAIRGVPTTVIDQESPLAGASGNPKALLTPKLVSLHKFDHSLMNISWLHCLRYWQQYPDILQVTPVIHLLEKKKEEQQQLAKAYPVDVLESLSPLQVSQLANINLDHDAIVFKQAGTLTPQALAQYILSSPLIQYKQAAIGYLEPQGQQWQLLNSEQNSIHTADHVIICTARHSPELAPSLPALKQIRGQVSWTSVAKDRLGSPISYGGYAAPLEQVTNENSLIMGASFIRGDDQSDVREADHLHNLHLLQSVAPELAEQLSPVGTWQGRASIRAQSNDFLPLVGAVEDMPQVWTLCGLGSRGFSYAPLCAEILCAQMLGEVFPVPQRVLPVIHAGRLKSKKSD